MKVLLVILSLIDLSWARKLPMTGDLAMQNPKLFEGDILGVKSIELLSGIPKMLWPNGVIPYKIDKSLMHRRSLIEKAMRHITNKTSRCITFKIRTKERNYIRIFPGGDGCNAHVGMRNEGEQKVSLDEGCHYFGVIVHELMHAIGFYHEQNRYDRDDYITIYTENIEEGMEINFEKLSPSVNPLYNGFDYNSVMIYGEYAFTKQEDLKTMEPKKDGVQLTGPRQKPGLSGSDVYRIKKHYGCI